MSGGRHKFWRIAKAILAFLCVPILISFPIMLAASLAIFVLHNWVPEDWSLRQLDSAFLFAGIGAQLCVPVAWFVGPLTFLGHDSGSRRLLWPQAAIGGGVGAFVGLIFAGIVSSSGSLLLGLILILLGALLGVMHALGLRYALLWLGLIGPTRDIDAGAQGTAANIYSEW